MGIGLRVAAVYALLGVVLAGSAAGGYVASRASAPRSASHRCWVSDGSLPAALFNAARCRLGEARVVRVGWMPYLGSQPGESRLEVSVLDPLGRWSFWIAEYEPAATGTRVEVRHWSRCTSNVYC